jgi:hypothetical protein
MACAGCPSAGSADAVAMSPSQWPAPVGGVDLVLDPNADEVSLLDVGLVIFDPGIPPDPAEHSEQGIFPQIRKAEARYMPVVLRHVLQETGAWGVVRVLPQADPAAELLVSGTIMQSDGLRLVLHLQATDATGRQWLNRVYVDESAESDYPAAPDTEPYADLYHQVANDLLAARSRLKEEELRAITEVALLRYAESLSPEAFAGYVIADTSGRYQVLRLPAQDDPMLSRVGRIRNQEYLFIDTIDEQYAELYEEMAPTYNLWRQYGREQAIYRDEYEKRAAGRDREGRRGSFFALQRTYDAYKWSKIQDQDLDELATGFNNEVQPTVMEASGKVFRLSGTLESQYDEWRSILSRIFALETGLPAPGSP